MLNRCVLAALFVFTISTTSWAQSLPPVTVGAGVQTSVLANMPKDDDSTAQFPLNSVRLYVNGPVADHIKFMFNTEYSSATNNVQILDAVARFEPSAKFNIWAGRFLPPSDRANLYGPYYSHHWAVYTDGIQDGYPFHSVGRDNGIAYWGQFGKVKVSGGGFDGKTTTGNPDVLGAARVQIDFWDPEDGYYLNGTYYGAKDLLALGFAVQAQSGNTAWNGDFLLEKKLGDDGGTVSVESQYNKYDKLGGYNSRYAASDGAYVLGAYLFPQLVGVGKIELLGKFAQANFEDGVSALDPDYNQKTTEINVNYLIKEFNARIMLFFKDTNFSAVQQDFKQFGVGIQIQM